MKTIMQHSFSSQLWLLWLLQDAPRVQEASQQATRVQTQCLAL